MPQVVLPRTRQGILDLVNEPPPGFQKSTGLHTYNRTFEIKLQDGLVELVHLAPRLISFGELAFYQEHHPFEEDKMIRLTTPHAVPVTKLKPSARMNFRSESISENLSNFPLKSQPFSLGPN
jgi:hypothetical protein